MSLPTLAEFHISMLEVANRAMGGTDRLVSLKPAQLINVATAVRQKADDFVRRAAEEVVRQSDAEGRDFERSKV